MLNVFRHRIASSLRYRLTVLVLVPIVLVAPITVGFVVYWSQGFSQAQLLRRVSADLAVAHDVFVRIQRDLLAQLEQVAASRAFYSAFAARDVQRIQDQLAAVRETTHFDFLHVSDLKGRWILGVDSETNYGGSKRTPLQQQAALEGRAGVAIEVFTASDLLDEDSSLEDDARIVLVDTPHAAPAERIVEERALVIRTIVPVRDPKGTIVAMLDGGVVLNRDVVLVDRVRDLVYGTGSLPEGSSGAASVFLGDVRVSTNVPLANGERAIGTRVSAQVRRAVLEQGRTWVNRAFVVTDWYISAYEPIVDVFGERVGMLYAGFLERPYRDAYYRTLGISLVMLVIGVLFAHFLAMRGARAIFKPIEAMAGAVRSIQAGGDRRIGSLDARDEIGELARQFDTTFGLLHQRNEEIRLAADSLESEVEARTRELREKNARLEQTIRLLHETRRQLISAEKLAALGELTAGVAHEINNPLAVIQGNLEVLRAELGDGLESVHVEMDLIVEQVARMQAIVEKLLSYSRPTSQRGFPSPVELRALIENTLRLVDHEAGKKSLTVETDLQSSVCVSIDPQELQQVLVNLLVNAVQASVHGGRIHVATRDWNNDHGVIIRVSDEGIGIPPEHLDRVFDPFFTTKGSGTGLGLSVSYGLIRRYGGDISVASRPGEGSAFEVFLLEDPVFSPAEPSIEEVT